MTRSAHNPISQLQTAATSQRSTPNRFAAFAWFTLAFNLLVVAIGTLVRATGSGDGCGSHWPTCNGATIPVPENIHTIFEYSHRISTAIDGLIVLALAGWGIAKYRKSPRRLYILGSLAVLLLMMAAEALVGRHLVLRGLVTTNATQERAVWMAVHLVTTFVLLFSLAAVAWWSSDHRPTLKLKGQGAVGAMVALGFALLLFVGVSGAITALGDTIFPVSTHEEAISLAQDPRSHFLLRLRIYHPFLAMGTGLFLVLVAALLNHLRPSRATFLGMLGVGSVLTLEMLLGYLNVLLKAPVWMQIVHLLAADFLWLGFVFLSLSALAVGVPQVEQELAAESQPDAAKATIRDYIGLTKPKVISLLLVTTITAMFIGASPEHPVTWPLLLCVFLGGYLSAGAAKVYNMVLDADLDRKMARTATRPTADNRIPPARALGFALILTIASVLILWIGANALASLLALAGLVFYVVVYTMLLKRRTYQNIVIGGAAGAFPPLVGWTAMGDGLSPLAWYLFAIIFLWTPAHFWALAMLLKDDYKAAGVPMLPVVKGEKNTVLQIGAYAILTAVVSLLPVLQGFVGWGYAVAAVVLNLVLLDYTIRLWRNPERKQASALFHYSMLYLALLFVAMAVDRSFLPGMPR